MTRSVDLSRDQILGFRRAAGALDERLTPRPGSLRQAAWAGLQDSMPRAALLSIHARVAETTHGTWEDPSLVQLWGPRFSAFVVARRDLPVFSLGRYPTTRAGRRVAEDMAEQLDAFLAGRRMGYGEAGAGLGLANANKLRYAAPTGRVLIRWDGARQPTIWTVPPPEVDPLEARLELARRHLHVFGPSTPAAFATWAGIGPADGRAAFDALAASLLAVRSPVGDGWILASDEAAFRAARSPSTAIRLLPSGDAYFLLWGAARELLVPDAAQRASLWTTRVWPGALLVAGELVGTWRRAGALVTIETWRRLTGPERDAVEAEVSSLPLPVLDAPTRTLWSD